MEGLGQLAGGPESGKAGRTGLAAVAGQPDAGVGAEAVVAIVVGAAQGVGQQQRMPARSLVQGREAERAELVQAEGTELDPPRRLEQAQAAVARRPRPARGHHRHRGTGAPALQVSQGRDGQGMGQVQTIYEQDQGGVAPHQCRQQLEGDHVAGPVGR